MTWGSVLIALGGGAAAAAVIKLIDNIIMHKLGRKAKTEDEEVESLEALEKRVSNLEEKGEVLSVQEIADRLKELEKRSKADFDHLKLIDSQIIRSALETQAMLKAIHALLSHSMTGNATGEMKTARDNLVNFIIDNK